ncbi:MAG: hypothetical protein IJJ09_06970, partial [Synergistaceae bacterium]|nr:hypothetical protein [Synergistaceae bacterium]
MKSRFNFYSAGMFLYRSCVNPFFKLGGLNLIKPKHKHNLSERTGNYSDIPENPIWVHAVSVGEVQSASALIRRIKTKNNSPCVISTVTQTGHDMAEKLLGDVVDKIIYSPFDAKKFVKNALDNIKP